jgi:DNA polymerase-3 subunit gamma/tau
LAIVDDLVMRGHNLRNFCRDVLGHLRDLLVVKVSGDPKLLDSSSAQTEALQQQAVLFSQSDLVRFFHSLAETEASLKDAANPRYQVEVGLVKLMEMRRLAPLSDLVARIAELESALRTGRAPAERKTARGAPTAPANSGTRTASAGSSGRSAGAYEAAPVSSDAAAESYEAPSAEMAGASPTPAGSLKEQIKAELEKKKKKMLIAAIAAAPRIELEGDDLVIEFSADDRHLAKPDTAKILREVSVEICGRNVGIRFATGNGGDDVPASPEEEQRRSKQKARLAAAENPRVQNVLRAFGGEIVDVKFSQ